MLKVFRYRLCATKAQETELFNQLRLCRNLYNAGLEERIGAYRKKKETLNYYDQANKLSEIKEALPEYKGGYSQVLQDVLKRLDKAYQAFFRRVKAGQKAGFPRFQVTCSPNLGSASTLVLEKVKLMYGDDLVSRCLA